MDYAKAFDCVDYNKLWKILKQMGIEDHLTYLLRNLYAGKETAELDMKQWTGPGQAHNALLEESRRPASVSLPRGGRSSCL